MDRDGAFAMTDSLKFGTSGLRGLASDLEGAATRQYTAAFLAHLAAMGQGGGSGRAARRERRTLAAAAQHGSAGPW